MFFRPHRFSKSKKSFRCLRNPQNNQRKKNKFKCLFSLSLALCREKRGVSTSYQPPKTGTKRDGRRSAWQTGKKNKIKERGVEKRKKNYIAFKCNALNVKKREKSLKKITFWDCRIISGWLTSTKLCTYRFYYFIFSSFYFLTVFLALPIFTSTISRLFFSFLFWGASVSCSVLHRKQADRRRKSTQTHLF